jgi:hypothetical protein
MNATGESDEQSWIELVVASQEEQLRDPIERFIEILFASKKGPSAGEPIDFSLVFPPPRDLSPLDEVGLRKTQSETDEKYLNLGVVTSEEVTQSRFGGPDYSTATILNRELREEQALAALQVVTQESAPQPDDAVDLRDLARDLNMRDTGPLRRMGKAGRFKIWRAGNAIIVSKREVIEAMQAPRTPPTPPEEVAGEGRDG